jgi:hypothetical protein
MVFSYWPFKYGFDAWVTHSRFGIAVANSPLGPYQFHKLLFNPTAPVPAVQHNPCMIRWNNHYILYFTGNDGPWSHNNDLDAACVTMQRPEWWEHRNNQRVWMAISADPMREWQIHPQPVFNPAPGYLLTATPFAFIRPDGLLQIVIKTARAGTPPRGGRVEHHTFWADSPSGPFRQISSNLLPGMKTDFPIDDHCQFHLMNNYYAIVKDHGEGLTRETPALLLLESNNGYDWQLAKDPLVTAFRLNWEDGSTRTYQRLEMPRIVFIDNTPALLQVSAYEGGNTKSFNMRLPLTLA